MKRHSSLVLTILCLSFASQVLLAQTQGNNAVYNGASTFAGSSAFIDASAVAGTSSNTDICAKINAALALIPTNTTGAVIDARGVSNLTCPSGDTPWKYPSTATAIVTPATILLPPGTITISTTWIVPNGTRVIGEGMGPTTLSSTSASTVIQSSSANPMIQLGSASPYCPSGVCTGVSVEDLLLNGEGTTTIGVLNQNSQEQSYVRRVGFYQILGSGIKVLSGAQNSGPYSDLVFGTGTAYSASNTTICAAINTVNTRGIHGLTCTNSGSSTPTSGGAVYLGGTGNSLEDITVQGFYDGVKVGSNAAAQSNVLLNIVGGSPKVSNAVIHIVTSNAVSDLMIMGVTKGSAAYSVQDDITASTPKLADSTIGMYAIGESASVTNATNAFSRFTTSPNLPSWIQGNSNATGSCTIGSLYSNSSGLSGSKNSWYVCTSTGWTGII